MNSTYITSKPRTTRQRPAAFKALAATFVAVLFGCLAVFSSFSTDNRKAEAFDSVQWAMCYFGSDSIPGMIYQSTQSSDLQFALRSKSSITSGIGDVESGLNWILDVFGPGFAKVNEPITGYSLEPFVDPEAEVPPAEERFNKGMKVNPFDRFGVAGLNFTAYTGEWKHVVIDACNPSASPQDPKAGVFYEDRLEPRSTWEDIDNTSDVRTKQFSRGFTSQFGTSMADMFANGIFNVTKTAVVITVGLINFSFTDIVQVMGINELLVGSDGGGMFSLLFSGIFTPLIVIVFAITGLKIFWDGIVQKQYRSALTTVLRSVVLFMIAIIIAAAPLSYITLPNKVAVIAQSIILNTMNSSLAGGNGLCSTNIGSVDIDLVKNPNAEPQDILTQASESMRSAVGCQFWQMFLLKPWVQGQFGTDWEKLYANGKIAEWAKMSTSADLKNQNEAMVGDAPVPMGDGTFIHNWALFQLSTQTNVHTPVGHEGEKSKYTAGVANDWWRIVDTLSNYQEEEATTEIHASGTNGFSENITYTVPKKTEVSQYWDTWTGNTAYNRMWTAMSSVIIAVIGLAAPLFFAFLSAVYSVGVAFLMAFAPIMLLLGCWAGKGWEIFKGWGELVVNTTLKRIATGILLSLVIGLEVAAIQLMETVGWWTGILMLIIVSVIMITSRAKIINMLASVRFASTNFSASAEKLTNSTMGAIKLPTRVATSAVMGGVGSKRYGQNFATGAKAAVRDELKQFGRRHDAFRSAMTEYDQAKMHDGELFDGQNTCATCGKRIDYEEDQMGQQFFHGARTASGNIICYQCFQDGVDPDALEIMSHRKDADARSKKRKEADAERDAEKETIESQAELIRKMRYTDKTAFNNPTSKANLNKIATGVGEDGKELSQEDRTAILRGVMGATGLDIGRHMKEQGLPAIPAEIQHLIDPDMLQTAWRKGQYDWIRQTYVAAFATWFVEITGDKILCSFEDLVEDTKVGKQRSNSNDEEKDEENKP